MRVEVINVELQQQACIPCFIQPRNHAVPFEPVINVCIVYSTVSCSPMATPVKDKKTQTQLFVFKPIALHAYQVAIISDDEILGIIDIKCCYNTTNTIGPCAKRASKPTPATLTQCINLS